MHAPDCAPEDFDAGFSAAGHSVGCSHVCGARRALPCPACPAVSLQAKGCWAPTAPTLASPTLAAMTGVQSRAVTEVEAQ